MNKLEEYAAKKIAEYRAEIEQWDWASIVQEALANVALNMEGEAEGSRYLGSVMTLAPSGKFYMPWACSNVEPCPLCNGSCVLPEDTCELCHGERVITVTEQQAELPYWLFQGKKAGDLVECYACHGTGRDTPTCWRCGGLGSEEAFFDSLYFEALDDIARENGGFITENEGDPTDVFFGMYVEAEEDECSSEEQEVD